MFYLLTLIEEEEQGEAENTHCCLEVWLKRGTMVDLGRLVKIFKQHMKLPTSI